MPRLRQVSRDEAPEGIVTSMYSVLFGDRDPVSEPGTATGTPGDWWTVFAFATQHRRRGLMSPNANTAARMGT